LRLDGPATDTTEIAADQSAQLRSADTAADRVAGFTCVLHRDCQAPQSGCIAGATSPITARSSASPARLKCAGRRCGADGKVVDLSAAIPQGTGWQLFDASAINARGEIAGDGVINGEFHAYLLTPVQ
jgi:hypothetical protein